MKTFARGFACPFTHSLTTNPPGQDFLESTFPSTTRAAPTPEALAAAATGDEKELDKEASEGRLVEPGHLHIGHTITKFVLDQTVGAAVNTVLFSTFTHSIQAAMAHRPATAGPGADSAAFLASGKALDYSQVDWRVVVARSRLDFWPLMRAALGLWPWVSLFNFTMVKTVEMRNLVGALAGVVWGIYMSLFAAQ